MHLTRIELVPRKLKLKVCTLEKVPQRDAKDVCKRPTLLLSRRELKVTVKRETAQRTCQQT